MDGLLSQLRDIRGLDTISWWPLAPAWWVLLALLIAVAGFVLITLGRRKSREPAWQSEALDIVNGLRVNQNTGMKQRASALSALLRRVAIKRFGRDECAGLEGRSWLAWLTNNDPGGFSWDQKGLVLIQAPYLPDDAVAAQENWSELLDAAEKWIK